MSNGTHLSHFAGDMKAWPVYMTIGNQLSKICQMRSMRSIIMVALLPLPIKNRNILQTRLDEQQQTNQEVLNKVLRLVLQPASFQLNSSAESRYYIIPCADGNFRRCKLVLAAWHDNCTEYSDLHHLERHVCFWCEYPKNELGDYVPPGKQHPRQDHNLHRTLSNSIATAANAELSSPHVEQGFIKFRHIPCIVSDVPKPDLLHQCR